ncbi:MAG TPA: aminotransferase class I/II-fold pyridoxal phosphate-dependent enzyme, partial [Flavobacteriaceae bacterium]|nr:aminotransferase class I/II-fold pyridoxal phosphate-dependent enzyme [Flavobacteriaceae bacterium]
MKFNTKVIHGKQKHDPATGAVMVPIYQTSTYVQSSPGKHKGYEYSRGENPTRDALENAFASIENAKHGLAFGSGLAAIDCVIRLFSPNDHIIAGDDLYGGTYRMFTKIFSKYGLTFTFVDMNNPENVAKAITKNTKMIWLETPTNPLLKVADIEAITKIAKENNIISAVDNTFATPYIHNPLDLGADIVMHSATKYLGGHSDLVMGALMVNDDELHQQLKFIQFAAGAITGPMDSFLALRGVKTLAIRMERHSSNGMAVAQFLESHPKVKQVYYPGLKSHPNYEVAKKQMRSFGGMVSFKLKDETQA